MARARDRLAGKRYILSLVLVVGAVLLAAHERNRWRPALLPLWVQTVRDVPYGPRPENRLDILLRRWSTGSNRPAAVIFHGGGWVGGGREDMVDRVCRRYLEQGFVVANVEYRKGAIAAAVEDAVLALKWFCRSAPSYGVDRNKILVTGESAGAHLALMSAFKSDERIAAVVNFYGVSDLMPLADRPAIRAVLPPGDPESSTRALSPVTYARLGLPPVFSIHGTADALIPTGQTALLTRAIQEAGGEAFELYIPGGSHGFSPAHQQMAYKAIFEFLKHRSIVDP